MADTLSAFIEQLADLVADRVVERLREGSSGVVDQTTSPLGRRRHIAAIRSGKLIGRQVGRQYLAQRADVDAYIRGTQRTHAVVEDHPDEVDQLADELGLRNNNGGKE